MFNKVLLVEDDERVREITKRQLEMKGFMVVVAVDGLDAWAKLGVESDLLGIVSDTEMPNMSGLELLRIVRTDSRFDHLIFVLVSGRLDFEINGVTVDLSNACMYPHTCFLHKPYRWVELVEVLVKK